MFSLTGGGGGGGVDKNKNSNSNNNSTLVKKDASATTTTTAATTTTTSSTTSSLSTSSSGTLKWHLKLKECERGRKATVDAKLLAIRDHLTALMHLTTAAHQETASTHRFLLGMALAQEQMAQVHYLSSSASASCVSPTTTDDASNNNNNNNKKPTDNNTRGKEAEKQQQQSSSLPSSSSSSLEQSNQLMEQKLSACAADIRGNVLMMSNNPTITTATNASSSSSSINNDSTGDMNNNINNNSSSAMIVNTTNNNTGTTGAGGSGGGLHHLLLTIQQQVRDLKRGQDYVEQLEELQRRIQKAWDAYLTRANISLGLGGGGPALNNAVGPSNSSANAANAKNNANNAKKKNDNSNSPDNDNSKTKEDLWLAEWYYRNLVSKQAQAWDKASTRLTKLFQSIRESECQRRMSIRKHLVLFSQFQQALFVGMEAASDIALLDYVGTEKKNNIDAAAAVVVSKDNNRTDSSPQRRRNSNESQPRRNSNESQTRRNSNESQTTGTITGFFGGIQQKLLGGMDEAGATMEEENIAPSSAANTSSSSLATGAGGETPAATAAVRKQVEVRLQTDIRRQLEEHPPSSLNQQKSSDDQHGGGGGALGDRDNILGFYQDIFPPQSPLESDHVVMSTVVQKNKKFLQPGSTTNVMILEGLALVVITTENIIHLFDLRENASVDETTTKTTTLEGNNNNTSRQHIITLQSPPALAYRAILEQHQRDQLMPLSSSSTLSASSPQSIKSRMVEYAKSSTATSSSSPSAISTSTHGGGGGDGGPVSEQVQESPEPCASLPLLECHLDTMRQENSIAIVHVKSSTRLELILPSAYEQVGMINTFARAAAAETAAEF